MGNVRSVVTATETSNASDTLRREGTTPLRFTGRDGEREQLCRVALGVGLCVCFACFGE